MTTGSAANLRATSPLPGAGLKKNSIDICEGWADSRGDESGSQTSFNPRSASIGDNSTSKAIFHPRKAVFGRAYTHVFIIRRFVTTARSQPGERIFAQFWPGRGIPTRKPACVTLKSAPRSFLNRRRAQSRQTRGSSTVQYHRDIGVPPALLLWGRLDLDRISAEKPFLYLLPGWEAHKREKGRCGRQGSANAPHFFSAPAQMGEGQKQPVGASGYIEASANRALQNGGQMPANQARAHPRFGFVVAIRKNRLLRRFLRRSPKSESWWLPTRLSDQTAASWG